MAPQDNKSKRPSLLAPEDAPEVHKSNSAISLSEIQENRPQRRIFWAVLPWVIGAFCMLLVIGGMHLWQTSGKGATSRIAQSPSTTDIAAAQEATQPPAGTSAPATPSASAAHVPPERSVATIIDYTAPIGSSKPERNSLEQNSNAAADKSSERQADNGEEAPASATTTTSGPRLATLSINLNEMADKKPATKIPEIEVLGAVPPAEPEPQRQAAPPEEADADVNIVATLMSYIDQRDAPAATDINIPLDAPTEPAQLAAPDKTLEYPLRAQLQECPPANTVEGIKCRQEVCAGYRGEAPACPAPQDVANGQRRASSAATQ